MEAGLALFGTAGYTGSPVGEICRAAGLSTRQYYAEFGSREALLVAIYDSINEEALQVVADTLGELPAAAPFSDRVLASLRGYVECTARDRRRARVAFLEIVGINPEIERHRLAWRQRWVSLIEAMADSAAAHDEIPARDHHLTATAFVGAVNGLLQDWCALDDGVGLDSIIDELNRFALAVNS